MKDLEHRALEAREGEDEGNRFVGVKVSCTRPEWWPVCTVTVTFRGFAASENLSEEKQSNPTVSENQGSLCSHSYFGGDYRSVKGPGLSGEQGVWIILAQHLHLDSHLPF